MTHDDLEVAHKRVRPFLEVMPVVVLSHRGRDLRRAHTVFYQRESRLVLIGASAGPAVIGDKNNAADCEHVNPASGPRAAEVLESPPVVGQIVVSY
jgi:hypothetical protein